ncbi:MAG TPA: nuclear transport factor 2 family protein [Terriglobales bacterium]|nr:nuclear transport factor 2 family protein [Terriglobales bacterium]
MRATVPDIASERELLTFVYDAFNGRDIEPILARMHPRVEWPNGMEGGWVYGREGVRSYWMRQWDLLNPRVEPVRYETDNDGRVVVDVHQVVCNLDGKVLLDRTIQHVYRITDGLIRHMEIRE